MKTVWKRGVCTNRGSLSMHKTLLVQLPSIEFEFKYGLAADPGPSLQQRKANELRKAKAL